MNIGDVKTVLLPCYAPADFAAGGDDGVGARRYERWRGTARRELVRHLAAGYVVELVAVRRHEFQAWLAANDIEDGLGSRLDYVRASRVAPRRSVRLGARSATAPRVLAS